MSLSRHGPVTPLIEPVETEMKRETNDPKSIDAKTVDPKSIDRRGFLRAVGGVSTAVAAAASPIAATEAEAYDPGGGETKARYRETDHVKTYYRTNRY